MRHDAYSKYIGDLSVGDVKQALNVYQIALNPNIGG